MARSNRREFLVGSATAAVSTLAGCIGSQGGSSNSGGSGEALKKVGVSTYVRGGSWITAFKQAGKFYGEDHDITVDIVPNQQSSSKQVQDIRQFANQGYDGILAGIWSTGAVESAIDYADKQGVPVFTVNADSSSPKVKMYVGFSNLTGGRKSGQQMVKALKKQKSEKDTWRVLNVRGPLGNQSADQRSQGFINVVKKTDRMKIAKTIVANNAQDQAKKKISQWLNANGTVDGIYSGNLSMGLGVVTALDQLGLLKKKSKDGHIVLTQMDGSPRVNPLIDKGYIDAAVDQPNYFYMPIAIKYLQKYVKNGEKALPDIGSKVTKKEFNIESYKHKGVKLWNTPIWSPAPIKKQNNHRWFQTNSIVITQQNASKPYLWGNIWDNSQ